MLTDTRQALLDAIRDNPDDDAPRLIYADWLDENDDPDRATYIRLQCEEARLPYGHPRRSGLSKHAYDLFHVHEKRWLAGTGQRNYHLFQRGFLHEIPLDGDDFVRVAERLWLREPVANVKFSGSDATAPQAIQQPLAQELRGIIVECMAGVKRDGLLHTLATANVPRLRRLVLQTLHADGVEADLAPLLAAWTLPSLHELELHFWSYDTANFGPMQRALLEARLWATVTKATVMGLNHADVLTVWPNTHTQRLRRLTIMLSEENRLLPAFARSPHLPALEALTISGRSLHADVLEAFCSSPLFRQLRRFVVQSFDWSVPMADLLFDVPNQLEELYLAGNKNLTDAFVLRLVERPCATLRYLNLAQTNVTTAAKERLREAWPECEVF